MDYCYNLNRYFMNYHKIIIPNKPVRIISPYINHINHIYQFCFNRFHVFDHEKPMKPL